MLASRGFSLIETLIFILVVGIGLSSILALLIETSRSSADPLVRERAVSIANAYMDEIMGRRFDEHTPLGGGCVETGSQRCTTYCAALEDPVCVRSRCRLQAAGQCVPRAQLSGFANEEGAREAYDDLDDYADLVESPRGLVGNAGDEADFLVSVNVTRPHASWHGIDPRDLRRIRVEVSSPLGETIRLQGVRVNF